MDFEYIKQSFKRIADCFYQERTEEGLQLFMQVAGELGKVTEFSECINPLFDALEQDNYIMAADIISHEMLEKIP